jgi:hypothetical protein
MNENIQKLLLEVVNMEGEDGELMPSLHTPEQIEKFATLIIRRCAITASMFSIDKHDIHPDIKWDDMTESAKMINHTTCQQVSMQILDNFGMLK